MAKFNSMTSCTHFWYNALLAAPLFSLDPSFTALSLWLLCFFFSSSSFSSSFSPLFPPSVWSLIPISQSPSQLLQPFLTFFFFFIPFLLALCLLLSPLPPHLLTSSLLIVLFCLLSPHTDEWFALIWSESFVVWSTNKLTLEGNFL